MKILLSRLAAMAFAALLTVEILPLRAAGRGQYDRVLNLHTDTPHTCYQVYAVADLLDVLFGVEKISREPTPAEQAAYCTPENRVAELVTDETGAAEINLTELELEDGVYLIARETGEGTYVCIPAPDPDGEGWLYTVDVYPEYIDSAEHSPAEPAEAVIPQSPPAADVGYLWTAAMCLLPASAAIMAVRTMRKNW